MQKQYLESVIFHSPGEFEASPLLYGSWRRPLSKLLVESDAACAFGNMVDDACGGFIRWCFTRPKPPVDYFSCHSLPGCPFKNSDWNRWDWYDSVMMEIASSEDAPYLVDTDAMLVTHKGQIIWPPPERRRMMPIDRAQKIEGEPFPRGWFGQSLGELRPGSGTYNCYALDELPPIRARLTGNFKWLDAARALRPMGNVEAIEGNLKKLIASNDFRLPNEFLTFFREPELWRRIRSCTDCYFSLDTQAVEIPGNLGLLVRFMSDSQDCKHWHLYLARDGSKHAVVATYVFRGSESAATRNGKPHPRDITTCADSFEGFMYRFWLENEILFASVDGCELPADAAEYLAFYKPS